jgi:NADH:ubiquinone oxidoreductase subunit K
MSIEVILNSANVNPVAFSCYAAGNARAKRRGSSA